MQEKVLDPLAAWDSFYVIVGSAGAALTGLQFVVIALVSEVNTRSSSEEIDAFATPSIVHFCAVLFVSCVLSAPWKMMSSAAITLGLCGSAGVLYVARVTLRAMRQKGYEPVLEDWIWHTIIPFAAYAAVLATGIRLVADTDGALFWVAGASIALLFDGIHNAWDTVTFITLKHIEAKKRTPAVPGDQAGVSTSAPLHRSHHNKKRS